MLISFDITGWVDRQIFYEELLALGKKPKIEIGAGRSEVKWWVK
jgi:hypothetical protein